MHMFIEQTAESTKRTARYSDKRLHTLALACKHPLAQTQTQIDTVREKGRNTKRNSKDLRMKWFGSDT